MVSPRLSHTSLAPRLSPRTKRYSLTCLSFACALYAPDSGHIGGLPELPGWPASKNGTHEPGLWLLSTQPSPPAEQRGAPQQARTHWYVDSSLSAPPRSPLPGTRRAKIFPASCSLQSTCLPFPWWGTPGPISLLGHHYTELVSSPGGDALASAGEGAASAW